MINFMQFGIILILLQQLFLSIYGAPLRTLEAKDAYPRSISESQISTRQLSASVDLPSTISGLVSGSLGAASGNGGIGFGLNSASGQTSGNQGGFSVDLNAAGGPQNTIERAGINLLRRGNGFLTNQVVTGLNDATVPINFLQSLSGNGRVAVNDLGLSAQGLTNRLLTAGANLANALMQDIGTNLGGSALIRVGSNAGSRSANLQSGSLPYFGGFSVSSGRNNLRRNNQGFGLGFGQSPFSFGGLNQFSTNNLASTFPQATNTFQQPSSSTNSFVTSTFPPTTNTFQLPSSTTSSFVSTTSLNNGNDSGTAELNPAIVSSSTNTIPSVQSANLNSGTSSIVSPALRFNSNLDIGTDNGLTFGNSPTYRTGVNVNGISSTLQSDLTNLMAASNMTSSGLSSGNASLAAAVSSNGGATLGSEGDISSGFTGAVGNAESLGMNDGNNNFAFGLSLGQGNGGLNLLSGTNLSDTSAENLSTLGTENSSEMNQAGSAAQFSTNAVSSLPSNVNAAGSSSIGTVGLTTSTPIRSNIGATRTATVN